MVTPWNREIWDSPANATEVLASGQRTTENNWMQGTGTEHRKGSSRAGTSRSFVGDIASEGNYTFQIIGASRSLAPTGNSNGVVCALVKACAGLSKNSIRKRLSSNISKSHLQRKDSLFTHMRLRVSLGLHSYSMTEKGLPHWQ